MYNLKKHSSKLSKAGNQLPSLIQNCYQENAEEYESQRTYCDIGVGVDQRGLQPFQFPIYILMIRTKQFILPFHVLPGSLGIGFLHFVVQHSFPQKYHIHVHIVRTPAYK